MSDALWKTLQARKNGQDTVHLNKHGVFHFAGIRHNRNGDGFWGRSSCGLEGLGIYMSWYPWPKPPEMWHER